MDLRVLALILCTFFNLFGNCLHTRTETYSEQSSKSCYENYQINNDLVKCIIELSEILDLKDTASDEAIISMAKEKRLETNYFNSALKNFLVFESLGSELIRLKTTLDNLCSIFTDQTFQSIIDTATIKNITKFTEDKEVLYKYCQKKSLKIVSWINYPNQSTCEKKIAKENELKQAINNKLFDSKWVEELQNKVKARAEIMASLQPAPSIKEINAKAQELANQAPEIPVIKYEQATRMVEKRRDNGYWKDSGGFIGSLVDKKRWVSNWVTYYEAETYDIPYISYEKPPYTEFVEEAKKLLAPKPAEYFYEEANKLIQKEIQEILTSDNSNRK
ncbi:hypothetical protein SteCoe_35273 [Stentor coeruleus]|uniref:Uncharacterized protein n=1 Tax=Stentor coeruleus TaxID=5963 RepID=A0A1R2ASN7_9CILI|nr:hypothetical protein SteCoe_35273 [Stentor coeruleus]